MCMAQQFGVGDVWNFNLLNKFVPFLVDAQFEW